MSDAINTPHDLLLRINFVESQKAQKHVILPIDICGDTDCNKRKKMANFLDTAEQKDTPKPCSWEKGKKSAKF